MVEARIGGSNVGDVFLVIKEYPLQTLAIGGLIAYGIYRVFFWVDDTIQKMSDAASALIAAVVTSKPDADVVKAKTALDEANKAVIAYLGKNPREALKANTIKAMALSDAAYGLYILWQGKETLEAMIEALKHPTRAWKAAKRRAYRIWRKWSRSVLGLENAIGKTARGMIDKVPGGQYIFWVPYVASKHLPVHVVDEFLGYLWGGDRDGAKGAVQRYMIEKEGTGPENLPQHA